MNLCFKGIYAKYRLKIEKEKSNIKNNYLVFFNLINMFLIHVIKTVCIY